MCRAGNPGSARFSAFIASCIFKAQSMGPTHHRFQGSFQGIEKGQNGISQKVHDNATMGLNHLDHPGEVAVDQMNGGFGLRVSAKGVKFRTSENRMTTSRFSPPMRLASGGLRALGRSHDQHSARRCC